VRVDQFMVPGPDGKLVSFLQADKKAMGANLDGWRLISVRGCSTDGQVMVGFGVNPSGQLEAFRTVITAPLHSVDFDGVGGLTVQDIFAYLNAWFASDPRADFNGGGLAAQDIFDFLNAWFAGCP
jgi:hypothetical protein